MQLFSIALLIVAEALICGVFYSIGFNAAKGYAPHSLSETIKKPLQSLTKAHKQEKKMRTLFENIEAYDGTAKNQREVK